MLFCSGLAKALPVQQLRHFAPHLEFAVVVQIWDCNNLILGILLGSGSCLGQGLGKRYCRTNNRGICEPVLLDLNLTCMGGGVRKHQSGS